MLVLIETRPPNGEQAVVLELALTAEERRRSRHRFDDLPDGQAVLLRLPRGTVLGDGDLVRSATGQWVRIVARPEPLLIATAAEPLTLLRAAYHLGNRHILVEIAPNETGWDLRLAPDPVLREMLLGLGLSVREAIAPFQPETGAYHHSH